MVNYVDTAHAELGRASDAGLPKDSPRSSATSPPSDDLQQHFGSLSELLFWWRINAGRFPRLVQLARQFCPLPVCASNDGDWRDRDSGQGSPESAATKQYTVELLADEGGDLVEVESGRTERMVLASQMLTVRMALLERQNSVSGRGSDR